MNLKIAKELVSLELCYMPLAKIYKPAYVEKSEGYMILSKEGSNNVPRMCK